jgi:hypothetical protein
VKAGKSEGLWLLWFNFKVNNLKGDDSEEIKRRRKEKHLVPK